MKTRFCGVLESPLPPSARRSGGRRLRALAGGGRWLVLLGLLALAAGLPLRAQILSSNRGLAQVALTGSINYQPLSLTPAAPSPALPLDLGGIANSAAVIAVLGLGSSAQQALATNGFVVVADGTQTDMAGTYLSLFGGVVPTVITSDSVLHLYHAQFNQILEAVETNRFFPEIVQMSQTLLEGATNDYAAYSGDLQEAALRDVAFASVALNLLGVSNTPPTAVADIVRGELANINAAAGFANSPLFNYMIDYSQFIPRGHYTDSPELEAYFKSMMWFGQMAFLLKGSDGSTAGLVSAEEARIQTLAAFLLTLELDQLQNDDQPIADTWNSVYTVTAFFVGVADDLTPYQYKEALTQVLGAQVNVLDLLDDDTFLALREALAAMPGPQIYGGTGEISLPPNATAAQFDALLDETVGMRLMGQRFVPDSYMMQQLVFPAVGLYMGTGQPFTLVPTLGGQIRGFPRGLDVMVVLGSDRALDILDSEGDTDYTNYAQSMNALIGQFAGFGVPDWTQNLYWFWLYSLQPLLEACPPGYPAFMQTTAWGDKQLNAALASWAELRHDTILYAKQSYTPIANSILIEPGYVEPIPELYHRLGALTRLTAAGLSNLNVLTPMASTNLTALGGMLDQLTDISTRELLGQGPTDDDVGYMAFFSNLAAQLGSPTGQPTPSTMVADVHTDSNSQSVLEEGVGYVKLMVAAYQYPDGTVYLGAGPVFSTYEFKWPMAGRLTDPAWTNLLASASAPAPPAWTGSFMDPVTLFPSATSSGAGGLPLRPPVLGSGGVRLQWPAQAAARYRALYSDDLRTWFLLETPVVANGSQATIVDPGISTSGARFYRVKPVY